ncbi:hypothetical protein KAK06_23125 [Ideonella sp. 4Y11]|uniref:Lipoprotein n=1 Tax=Ideonella aquatica TaxID=2824119 RepID=A0A940YPW1_9BURK|nr:hypothetical protein [Ideonella aquatica]MBQ0961849.1 hypothetical protein [Ideonella aquatica]
MLLSRPALCALASLLVGLLMSGCATPSLVGTWCNPDASGCWAWDRFSSDGRFEACGRALDDPQPFRGAGTWTLQGQRMCYVVEQTTPNFWLPPGQRYCTDIVALGRHEHRYRDLDTGAVFTLHRVADTDRHCPGEPPR